MGRRACPLDRKSTGMTVRKLASKHSVGGLASTPAQRGGGGWGREHDGLEDKHTGSNPKGYLGCKHAVSSQPWAWSAWALTEGRNKEHNSPTVAVCRAGGRWVVMVEQ